MLCDEGVPDTGEAKLLHGTLRKILIQLRYGGGTVYAYAVKNVPVPGAPGKEVGENVRQ